MPPLNYKLYHPKKTDRNHAEIMLTFRQLGCMVESLHEVGGGVFDLILAVDFLNVLIEVKDHQKPPSARSFTPDQKRFNFAWTGLRVVVTTVAEAFSLVEQLRAIVKTMRELERNSQISLSVHGCTERMYQPSLF